MNTEIHAFLKAELDRVMAHSATEDGRPSCEIVVSPICNCDHGGVEDACNWLRFAKMKKFSKHAKSGILAKNGGYILAIVDLADIQYIEMAINEAERRDEK
jgi:hypothetical protein